MQFEFRFYKDNRLVPISGIHDCKLSPEVEQKINEFRNQVEPRLDKKRTLRVSVYDDRDEVLFCVW